MTNYHRHRERRTSSSRYHHVNSISTGYDDDAAADVAATSSGRNRLRMYRAVKLSVVITTLSLLMLAIPNEASTRLARIGRPTVTKFTIDITNYRNNVDDDDDDDGHDHSLTIDIRPSHHDGQKKYQHQHQHQRREEQQQIRRWSSTTRQNDRNTASRQSTTKLSQLTQSFKDAFQAGNSIDRRKQQHQHQHQRNRGYTGIFSHDTSNNGSRLHVGKMLSAMEEMEEHMRSVGMTQTANDLKNNIEKAKRLYQSAPPDKRDSLSDLLQWEIDTGIHGDSKKNNKLRVSGRSGAMGLFWIGHNVEYQNDLYKLMLDKGYTPLQAANTAFEQRLEPHMEWPTKNIVKAAIPRMTPATQTEFFSVLSGCSNNNDCYGPQEHENVTRDVQSILDVWEPMMDDWKTTFDRLQLTDI